jgi:hypothetical protein
MEEGNFKPAASKIGRPHLEKSKVVWKYHEEAKTLGRDKAVSGVYNNPGV